MKVKSVVAVLNCYLLNKIEKLKVITLLLEKELIKNILIVRR